MFCIAVTSAAVRGLCVSAARRCASGTPIFVQPGDALPDAAVLVHDFLPDAMRSCVWLNTVAGTARALQVIAVLDSPASPALHALAPHSLRFVCADIVLAAESTSASLADVFADVLHRTDAEVVTQLLSLAWTIDPLLASVARHALTMNDASLGVPDVRRRTYHGNWPTEAQLLAATGIPRGTFVRHAERAGFRPALRFLHVVRVLGVATVLRADRVTIEHAAARYGYSSTGTLRRHFRELTGLSPGSARMLLPHELVQQMRSSAPVWSARQGESPHVR